MIKSKSTAANAALFMIAIIWGAGFVAGKIALEGYDPFVILSYRFLLAAAICGIVFFNKIKTVTKDVVIKGSIIGTLQFAALGVQLIGLQYTTSAKQSFLCTAYVALVPFLSWAVLKIRPSLKAFAAGFLALIGIGFISLENSLTVGYGDSLSLLCSIFFGMQIVMVGRYSSECDGIQLTFFQLLSAGILATVIGLIKGDVFMIYHLNSLLSIGYLAILNTFVAFLVQNIAQKYTKDTTASLIMSFESVFGFLFSVLFYHDKISLKLLIGCALCFSAVIISNVNLKKPITD